jgi:hypothetical protein
MAMANIYALTIHSRGKNQGFHSKLNDIYILKIDFYSLNLVK